jgi:hypothetical protein
VVVLLRAVGKGGAPEKRGYNMYMLEAEGRTEWSEVAAGGVVAAAGLQAVAGGEGIPGDGEALRDV